MSIWDLLGAYMAYRGSKPQNPKDFTPVTTPNEDELFKRITGMLDYSPARSYVSEYADQFLKGMNQPGSAANYSPNYASPLMAGQKVPTGPTIDFNQYMPQYWRSDYKGPFYPGGTAPGNNPAVNGTGGGGGGQNSDPSGLSPESVINPHGQRQPLVRTSDVDENGPNSMMPSLGPKVPNYNELSPNERANWDAATQRFQDFLRTGGQITWSIIKDIASSSGIPNPIAWWHHVQQITGAGRPSGTPGSGPGGAGSGAGVAGGGR